MRVAAIILFLFLNIDGFCCTCAPFEKENVNRLIREAEYALLGTPVEIMDWRSEFEENRQDNTQGTGIRLKVDSVMKGKIKAEYVIVSAIS